MSNGKRRFGITATIAALLLQIVALRSYAQQPETETIYEAKEVTQPPKILYKEKAVYTKDARDNKISGIVVLSAVFRANGKITDVRIVRGLPHGLSESAIEAAKKIRFEPARKADQPVSMRAKLEFSFSTEFR